MSDVIAVRVPKELKDELENLDIDYADEIRRHLERLIKQNKLKKVIKNVEEFRAKLRKKGTTSSSADIIREDRGHVH